MSEIVFLMVANHAEIQNGNLYALGLGWNWCLRPVPTSFVVARALVAPARLEEELTWNFTLVDADGGVCSLPPEAEFTWQAAGTSLDGVYPGTQVLVWATLRVPAFDLAPGRYQWQLEFDGEQATYPFTVIDQPTT